MNWRLVFALSGFGVAMGFLTVFFIPSNVEPVFWLVIFLFCAWVIARRVERRHYLHGLMVGIVNSVWMTAVRAWFVDVYLARHPNEAALAAGMSYSPRVIILLTGPVIGVLSGVLLALLAFVAAKFIKRPAPAR
ncbi:MAG TPA: hypothetical protein VIV57_19065 [Anaeromyxobacter sp.]